jgi:hypothetical protein
LPGAWPAGDRLGLHPRRARHRLGEPVGFFWGDDTDTARPDAWCWACEQALRAVPVGESTEAWFLACDYKVLCAGCWDLAKSRLYESRRG